LWLNVDDEDCVPKYRRMSKFRHYQRSHLEAEVVYSEVRCQSSAGENTSGWMAKRGCCAEMAKAALQNV
jgi:hypothetical protein